jgi:murein DD-endopeptidase MepM/ murein hydrolase activator NlpD
MRFSATVASGDRPAKSPVSSPTQPPGLRRVRRLLAALGLLLATLGLAGARAGAEPGPTATGHRPSGLISASRSATSYALPLTGPLQVALPFRAPTSRYGAGHRGVDLVATPRATVRAAAAGVVSFAGPVAGRGVVVIAHADGISTEYEPLSVAVRSGQPVARGEAIGELSGNHLHCGDAACLHWGAWRDTALRGYFDPLSLLGPLGPLRLVPADR